MCIGAALPGLTCDQSSHWSRPLRTQLLRLEAPASSLSPSLSLSLSPCSLSLWDFCATLSRPFCHFSRLSGFLWCQLSRSFCCLSHFFLCILCQPSCSFWPFSLALSMIVPALSLFLPFLSLLFMFLCHLSRTFCLFCLFCTISLAPFLTIF